MDQMWYCPDDELMKKVFGSITKVFVHILLVLTICTSNGQKLMLDKQSLERPIDSSLFFGKRVKPITVALE